MSKKFFTDKIHHINHLQVCSGSECPCGWFVFRSHQIILGLLNKQAMPSDFNNLYYASVRGITNVMSLKSMSLRSYAALMGGFPLNASV